MTKTMSGWELADPNKLIDNQRIDTLDQFVTAYPLAAFNNEKNQLFIIRKYHLSEEGPPDEHGFRMGMAWYGLSNRKMWFRLPATLHYQCIYIEPEKFHTESNFIIKTSEGEVVTNLSEISQAFPVWEKQDLSEEVLVERFFGLKNTRPPPSTAPPKKTNIDISKISSKTLGIMSQLSYEEYYSEPVPIPFLNQTPIRLLYCFDPKRDEQFIDDADKALSNFLKKTNEDRLALSGEIHQMCLNFIELVDLYEESPLWDMKTPEDVWEYVRLRKDVGDEAGAGGYVMRDRNGEVYIHLSYFCDWDEEHGLQLFFDSKGKVTVE